MTGDDDSRTASEEPRTLPAGLAGRRVRLLSLSVVVLVVLVVGLSVANSSAACATVEHYPAAEFDVTYANATLSLTHASGESIGREWADRTFVHVRTADGDRAGYPFPADSPYPLESDDTVRIADLTVSGDPLGTGAAVTVTYEKRVEYPFYCIHRSESVVYFDGRLAANGTVV